MHVLNYQIIMEVLGQILLPQVVVPQLNVAHDRGLFLTMVIQIWMVIATEMIAEA